MHACYRTVARVGDLMVVAGRSPVIGVSDRTWRQLRITCVDEVVVVDLKDVLGVPPWVALFVLLGGEHFACVRADERLLSQIGRGEDAQALRTGVPYHDKVELQGVEGPRSPRRLLQAATLFISWTGATLRGSSWLHVLRGFDLPHSRRQRVGAPHPQLHRSIVYCRLRRTMYGESVRSPSAPWSAAEAQLPHVGSAERRAATCKLNSSWQSLPECTRGVQGLCARPDWRPLFCGREQHRQSSCRIESVRVRAARVSARGAVFCGGRGFLWRTHCSSTTSTGL